MSQTETLYYILVNAELQYSIWPSYKPLPSGWQIEGEAQSQQQCLDWIEQNWTDMRPLSLRRAQDLV